MRSGLLSSGMLLYTFLAAAIFIAFTWAGNTVVNEFRWAFTSSLNQCASNIKETCCFKTKTKTKTNPQNCRLRF
jgi:hypothetical protein